MLTVPKNEQGKHEALASALFPKYVRYVDPTGMLLLAERSVMITSVQEAREAAQQTVSYLRKIGCIQSADDANSFEKYLEREFTRALVAQHVRGTVIKRVDWLLPEIANTLNGICDTARRVYGDGR